MFTFFFGVSCCSTWHFIHLLEKLKPAYTQTIIIIGHLFDALQLFSFPFDFFNFKPFWFLRQKKNILISCTLVDKGQFGWFINLSIVSAFIMVRRLIWVLGNHNSLSVVRRIAIYVFHVRLITFYTVLSRFWVCVMLWGMRFWFECDNSMRILWDEKINWR